MKLTRRQFIKGMVITGASLGLPIPSFSARRPPYVKKGDIVDYIGSHPGGFGGGQVVKEVKAWDHTGYPVILMTNNFPPREEVFYDHDLYDFIHDEDLKYFWADPENVKKYPNVHTFARVKRFGETVEEAIRHLNFASTDIFLKRHCNV